MTLQTYGNTTAPLSLWSTTTLPDNQWNPFWTRGYAELGNETAALQFRALFYTDASGLVALDDVDLNMTGLCSCLQDQFTCNLPQGGQICINNTQMYRLY